MKPIYPTNNSDKNLSSTDKNASTNPFGKKDNRQQPTQNQDKNMSGGMKKDNLNKQHTPGSNKGNQNWGRDTSGRSDTTGSGTGTTQKGK